MPNGTPKPIEAFGKKYPSISALCKDHGISTNTFRQRITVNGMTPEEAIKAPHKKAQPVACPRIYGVRFASIAEALTHYKTPRILYRERRAKGWEIITAIIAKDTVTEEPCWAKDQYWDSEEAMCAAHNVDWEIYYHRVHNHNWPRSRASTLPEIITNARPPMMFPDELRRVINTYTCEAHKEDECTIWPGQLAKSGFIEVYAMRKRYSVPRLVYCMAHDVHPNDLSSRVSVSPVCGNVRCINPDHMLAVLNRRRNNWKGPRPDDQPAQEEEEIPEDKILIPEEVIVQARTLMRTGWTDIGGIACVLKVEADQLKQQLGI